MSAHVFRELSPLCAILTSGVGFVGQVLSLMGTWMQSVAQGWLVYELTGSKLMLGDDLLYRLDSDLTFDAAGGRNRGSNVQAQDDVGHPGGYDGVCVYLGAADRHEEPIGVAYCRFGVRTGGSPMLLIRRPAWR